MGILALFINAFYKKYLALIEDKYNISIKYDYIPITYKKLYEIMNSNFQDIYSIAIKDETSSYDILSKARYITQWPIELLMYSGKFNLNSEYYTNLIIKQNDFSNLYGKDLLTLFQKYLLNDFIFLSLLSFLAEYNMHSSIDSKMYFIPSYKQFFSPYKTSDITAFTIVFSDMIGDRFVFSHRKQYISDYDIWNAIIIKDCYLKFPYPEFVWQDGIFSKYETIGNINLFKHYDKFFILRELDPVKFLIIKRLFEERPSPRKGSVWLSPYSEP